MDKTLRLELIQERLVERGLNQSGLAKHLGLSRAAVSKWFQGKAVPRPAELLKLGKLLGLGFKEIVAFPDAVPEPLVAFRKRAGTITTDQHLERAREMGRLLEPLVPHLGYDRFVTPCRLKQPVLEYPYIQQLVTKLRLDLNLDPVKPIDFPDLIGCFGELQAVLVPVMWGAKARHENALHIYLPASQTTWVFLNLDSQLHDFKFWMAHELGHVLGVGLLEAGETDDSEDFADAFAGALLFPEAAVEGVFRDYARATSDPGRIRILLACAGAYVISPFSVYKELEKHADARSLPFEKVDQRFLHSQIAARNQQFPTISRLLFDGHKPSADHYMRRAAEVFATPVFRALGDYMKQAEVSASVISRMFDIPLVDAKELKQALA